MGIKYQLRWTAVLPAVIGLLIPLVVLCVGFRVVFDLLIDGEFGGIGGVALSAAIGVFLTLLSVMALRQGYLSFRLDEIEVARSGALIGFRWADFTGVSTEGGKEVLTFATSTVRSARGRPVSAKVLRRLRADGADRWIVIGDYLEDWRNSPVGDLVEQHSA